MEWRELEEWTLGIEQVRVTSREHALDLSLLIQA